MSSCTGSVFGDTTLQNVKSGDYLAKSVSSDDMVLYHSTGQRLDAYRDPAGHLIIYVCGTNYVFTDIASAKCTKGYVSCAYVAPYTDSPAQWWNRYISGDDWYVQAVGSHARGFVLDDPGGTSAQGTQATLKKLYSNDDNELFKASS